MKICKRFALIAVLVMAAVAVFSPRARADLLVSSASTDNVKRYNETTGAFIDTFASGGGLDGPSFLTFTPQQAVPEPGTLTLLAIGLAGFGITAPLRKAKAQADTVTS